MKQILFITLVLAANVVFGQISTTPEANNNITNIKPNKSALKFNLNDDGTHYFQVVLLNQTWLRFDQSNPGTMVASMNKKNTFDIGLRRTRIQLLGQITDKVFIYFQFGQNNFNAQFNANGNRKIAPFFHDALCEYKLSKGNQLRLGAGLTVASGLSRFSQPSVGSIMTMDVPVFAQYSVDQTDQFNRRLSVYARGQLGKIDYRFVLSDPFPITSNGQALVPISSDANFCSRVNRVSVNIPTNDCAPPTPNLSLNKLSPVVSEGNSL